MSEALAVLAVPVIGIVAWIIGGWMIVDGMKNKGKLVSRTAGVVGGFVIGFIAFVVSMIVMGANEETKTNTSSQVVSSTPGEEAKDVKTFSISSDTYISRMNNVLSRMDKPIVIDLAMKELEFSSIGEYQYDKKIKLTVLADNGDHKLRGAIISSINDGSTETSLNTVTLVVPAFMSVMDEKSSKDIPFMDIITNLTAGKYKDDIYEVNGVHYSLVHKDDVDLFFIRPI